MRLGDALSPALLGREALQLGVLAALFALGTTTVIGSVIAIPDEATAPLMASFHRHLAAGLASSEALARAQTERGAAAFVNLGAG